MASTRQVPNRSAIAPKKGWLKPQQRFCNAIARPKVVRSQPVSASIGSWKKPIAERGPKVTRNDRASGDDRPGHLLTRCDGADAPETADMGYLLIDEGGTLRGG